MKKSSIVLTREFISFLKSNQRDRRRSKRVILIEMQENKSAQIAQSIFLQTSFDVSAELIAYSPYLATPRVKILLYRFALFFRVHRPTSWPFAVYLAMGAQRILFVKSNKVAYFEKRRLRKLFSSMSKREILFFNYCGIRIGDLFYDSYLRAAGVPTIDPRLPECQKAFIDFMGGVLFWKKYFGSHDVAEVLITHSVYEQGIPARFAIKENRDVFLVTSDRLFRLNQIDYLSDLEFKYYDPNAKFFNNYLIKISKSSERLDQLFKGVIGVDIAHSFVSGLAGNGSDRIVSARLPVRVLIAAHCFSDSPHANGDHIFADFWEWLSFLGNLALETEYEWYIKAHPAFFESDKDIFENFCKQFPHIIPIPSSYSNPELIGQGVNVVLTVYGTIAFEAAYLGALVIDASENTPHMNYGFTAKPRNEIQYREMLLNLDELITSFPKFDTNEILHFYDVHHLRKSENWLFRDFYSEMLEVMGGVNLQYSDPRIYEYWMHLLSSTSHAKALLGDIEDFKRSNRYVY